MTHPGCRLLAYRLPDDGLRQGFLVVVGRLQLTVPVILFPWLFLSDYDTLPRIAFDHRVERLQLLANSTYSTCSACLIVRGQMIQ